MKVRLNRTRMAMEGNVYSYDAVVPVSEVDRDRHTYFIVQDGEQYVPFEDAVRPIEIDVMPRGTERYEAFMTHRCNAKLHELEIIWANFPELSGVPRTGLIELPSLCLQHATILVNI